MKCEGWTEWTDKQTDGMTDNGEVVPLCWFCFQADTKIRFVYISEYSANQLMAESIFFRQKFEFVSS